MNANDKSFFAPRIDVLLGLLAVGVLLICLYYTFAYVFLTSYPGFEHDAQWVVLSFDETCDSHPDWCAANRDTLQVGDHLLTIGDLTYQKYWSDNTVVPFAGYKPGDFVPITFVRDGVVQQTRWQMLGPTPARQRFRWAVMLPFVPFWLAGTIVLLFLRPRDIRWCLLVAFNYLTAMWWAIGAVSSTQVAMSSPLLRVLSWLLVPIYLHLHVLVPAPLFARPYRYPLALLYALAVILAGLGFLQLSPSWVYYLSLLVAAAGSTGMLLARLRGKVSPSARLATRQMLAGIALAFGPGIVLWVVPGLINAPPSGLLNFYLITLAVASLPFFYIYALYKRRLGGLEFRANRVLSLFSFLILYLTAFVLTFAILGQGIALTPQALGFALSLSVAFITAGLFLRAPFQRFIDRLAYGTVHNPDDIVRAFANEIPRALNRERLIQLLTHEVTPSLLIRQFAIYLVTDGQAALFYASGVTLDPATDASQQIRDLLTTAKRYRPPEFDSESASQDGQGFDWVRLTIPIEVGGKTVGAWLLGGRDPDDYYPRPDIELLATLASQIGIALETAHLIEELQRRASELEKAYQELQELDRLKDEFVQNVSHELRTPLALVRGYTELLLEGPLGELGSEQREALETILERTEAVIRLVNDILSFQKISTESLAYEPIALDELARSCLETAEIIAQKKAQGKKAYQFELDTAEGVPTIWGDRNRLRQVFDNLLDNAIKFSPEGGRITIQIRLCHYHFISRQTDTPQEPAVEVMISDQGIGIPADQLDRIWERFYQVDGSTTRQFGGVGLGLAIVRSIVQAHGGAIWATSEVGAGTTFHFVLPVLPPLAQTAGPGDGGQTKSGQPSAISYQPTTTGD